LAASRAAALEASNFSDSEYYPPPHYTNLQYQVFAAHARSLLGDRQLLLTKVKVQSFKVTGELELVIEAPECVYDQNDRTNSTVGSPGPLLVQSGDGRFRIAGEGFVWRVDESRVVISNRVHATLATTNTAGPLEITSRWFEFDEKQRRGVFHDEVRGGDTNFDFTCGRLSVSAPTNQPGAATNRAAFDLIEADGSLDVVGKAGGKQAGRRASARRGVYRHSEEHVELTGDAKWQLDGRSGQSDRVSVRKADESFEAVGHVALQSPRESLGAAGSLLNASNAPAASPQDSPMVDLFAERCTFRTNGFIAEGGVRLLYTTNQLSCDRLEARQAPEKIAVATGHVIVSREGGSIVADRADYTEADGALIFTGDPRWRIDQNSGFAERLTLRTRAGEVFAENKVKVTVPLGPDTGSFLNFFPGEAATNSTPAVIDVFAQSFLARTNDRLVTFAGGVRVYQSPRTNSDPRLQSDELSLRFSTNARPSIERLEARRNVVFEQGAPGMTNGPATYRRMTAHTLAADAEPVTRKLRELAVDGDVKIEAPDIRASGDRGVYTPAADTFKLTGKTVLETPEMIFTESPEIYWSQAEKKFGAREPYVIKFKGKPDALKRASQSQKLP